MTWFDGEVLNIAYKNRSQNVGLFQEINVKTNVQTIVSEKHNIQNYTWQTIINY